MVPTLLVIFGLCACHLTNGRVITPEEEDFIGRDPDKYPYIPYRGDLFQGDIKLKDPKQGEPETPNQLNAVWNKNLLWPNNVIYFWIRREEFSAAELNDIYAGIHRLEDNLSIGGSPCIDFVETTSFSNYVNVRRLSGCYSYVGMIGGSQEMSLGYGCHRPGTVQHEFLHALGFYHEHSRGDRDDYISIDFDNINPDYWYAFNKYEDGVTIDHLGMPYDYNSVMHYHAYAFAIDSSRPTIIPHDPDADIGHKDWLSPIDTEMTQILYGCVKAEDSTYFKHLTNVDIFE